MNNMEGGFVPHTRKGSEETETAETLDMPETLRSNELETNKEGREYLTMEVTPDGDIVYYGGDYLPKRDE